MPAAIDEVQRVPEILLEIKRVVDREVDSGLAAHLLSLDRDRLAADEALAGGLFEGFVRMELVKQSEWSEARPTVLHFRSRGGGREVMRC